MTHDDRNRDVVRLEEWTRSFELRGESPAIPAATVVMLRDRHDGIETLMLHKTSEIAFGGMWVFPAGRIDPEDEHESGDEILTARTSAVREAQEEAAVGVEPESLVHFAYWIPPPQLKKRFGTWFFAARASDEEVVIDDGEIVHHEWMTPDAALRRRDAGEIELAPPTWVTLWTIGRYGSVSDALSALEARPPRDYQTHLGKGPDGDLVAMWAGDAGYDERDPTVVGPPAPTDHVGHRIPLRRLRLSRSRLNHSRQQPPRPTLGHGARHQAASPSTTPTTWGESTFEPGRPPTQAA